jgi:hypothetical protein
MPFAVALCAVDVSGLCGAAIERAVTRVTQEWLTARRGFPNSPEIQLPRIAPRGSLWAGKQRAAGDGKILFAAVAAEAERTIRRVDFKGFDRTAGRTKRSAIGLQDDHHRRAPDKSLEIAKQIAIAERKQIQALLGEARKLLQEMK